MWKFALKLVISKIIERIFRKKTIKPKTKEVVSDIKEKDILMEKVNLNTASEKELQKIIHIGPRRAKKIINRRPYRDIYELSNVLGLGRKRMDEIFEQGIIIT